MPMFDSPKDVPHGIMTTKFDIDGWQFCFVTATQGDLWYFNWTQTQHLVCNATFRFVLHKREIRPHCPKCGIRMPLESWNIAKDLLGTLAYGNKIA